MVANAFAWAERHGRKRKNEIHGEVEIQIVLEETFKKEKTYTEQSEQSGTVEVQVWWFQTVCTRIMSWKGVKLTGSTCPRLDQDDAGTLFDSDIPDMGQPSAALPALPAQQSSKPSVGLGNTSVVSSFKLLELILLQYKVGTLQKMSNVTVESSAFLSGKFEQSH